VKVQMRKDRVGQDLEVHRQISITASTMPWQDFPGNSVIP
jgi:hypothetical protein